MSAHVAIVAGAGGEFGHATTTALGASGLTAVAVDRNEHALRELPDRVRPQVADMAGAASLFGPDVIRVGREETERLPLRDNDPARPVPEVTFADRYTQRTSPALTAPARADPRTKAAGHVCPHHRRRPRAVTATPPDAWP